MTDPTSMLPGSDRPRTLRSDERNRLRQRLGFDIEAAATADAVLIEPTPLRPHRQRRTRWVAVAAVIVVLTATLTVWRNRPTSETVADQPTSVCADTVPPLAAALEEWGGLDRWLLSEGGEPDVGALLADLLDALATSDPARSDLQDAAEQVRSVLASSTDGSSMAERLEFDEARNATLRNALVLTIETVDGLPDPACDAGALRTG